MGADGPRLESVSSIQPENHGAHSPPAWVLDLLDELPRLNGLRPTPTPLVYVTRQGQTALGNGGHAGEGALVRALERAGAVVIDPACLPLRAQLKAYAGARHLVFAEGSAVHGRQLLGRLEQDVLILNRRPGTRMVPAQLDARCKLLTYAEPIAHFAAPRDAAGSPSADRGLALPDLPALARALDACGLDLARHWNTEDFRTEVSRDVAAWAAAMRLLPEVDTNLTRPVLGALEAAARELPGL